MDVPVHLPMVLTELGYLAELRGDPHIAARLHGEAYDLSRKIGALRDTAQALEGLLAGTLVAAGSPTAAATVLGAAAAERTAAELPPAPAERDDVVRARRPQGNRKRGCQAGTVSSSLRFPVIGERHEAGRWSGWCRPR